MKLCVNYLSEVKELIEEGKIDFIDYIKLYSINDDLSPFDWCVSKKNVMFHGMLGGFANIGANNFLSGRDIELQKDYYRRGNTPYISSHININPDDEVTSEECEEIIRNNIRAIRDNFDMKIILENVPASRINNRNHICASPEFVTKVVTENDCGLLFDIGHARVAADVLNIPFNEYVDRLPMDRVVEMHLAGCMIKKDGDIVANHSKMNEEDFNFIKDAIKKYNTLEVVTLEYGPFVAYELKDECPKVCYEKVDQKAKEEVYEQLLRLKEILSK